LTGSEHDWGHSLQSRDLAGGASVQELARLWRRLLLQISGIFVRLAMGVLFFAVVTPAGIVMRLVGRDPLRLRLERERESYWLRRSSKNGPSSMRKQY
jgi:hypothetical protein